MQEAPIPDAEALRALLADIAACHMPYGMYGPAKYPPEGCTVIPMDAQCPIGWSMKR